MHSCGKSVVSFLERIMKYKKYLLTGYCSVLVLIVLFPPWMITNPDHLAYSTFAGFQYIFGKHYYMNIHVTFLFLEILVVTLIFVVILYTYKEDKCQKY